MQAADPRKQAVREAKQRDQKLSTQLGKIKDMLTDQYGERHETAFKSKDKRKKEAATPAVPQSQRAKRIKL